MSRHQQFRVTDADGATGRVLVTSRFLDDRPHKLIRLENGEEILAPSQLLKPQDDGSFTLDASFSQLRGQSRGESGPDTHHAESRQEVRREDEMVVPVMEEELDVQRRVVEAGRITVHKRVETVESVVDEPTHHLSYDIRRVGINRVVDEAPEPRYEGDVLVLPILEEVLVVEKRLVLTEEVRITPKREELRDPQTHTTRREHAEVERV